jgi:hypothetical protein
MKKIIVAFIVLILLALFWYVIKPGVFVGNQPARDSSNANQNTNSVSSNADTLPVNVNSPITELVNATIGPFQPPLDRAAERVTKKPFGLFITPQNSPIQPERFRGYHTGADFEIFPEELDADVAVQTICAGPLLQKRTAGGYGGVAIQSCSLDGQPITVIYGHLKLTGITANTGDMLAAGAALGLLGDDHSTETDGERKHLHLGIHRGPAVNILGYVGTSSELAGWIDPCLYVCAAQ